MCNRNKFTRATAFWFLMWRVYVNLPSKMCFYPCKLHAAFTWLSKLRSAEVCCHGFYHTWKQKEKSIVKRRSRCDNRNSEFKKPQTFLSLYKPVQVGRLWVVDVLPLLSYSGCVVCDALTLGGLQHVVLALWFNVCRGQGHVIRPVYCPIDLRRLGVRFSWIETFVVRGWWGGHVAHLDVWDAGLPQDQFWVGQLQLLHVIDGDSSVKSLLWSENRQEGQKKDLSA